MTFISDTCSPWRRLYAVLSGTRQWMDTPSVITATHSLVMFIERQRRRRRRWSRRIFTRPMHAHLLNRNNTFLMENSEYRAVRAYAGWVLPFLNLFSHLRRINMWIHYALKSGKMIHRGSYWKPWTLWRARSRHEKVVGVIDRSIKTGNNANSCFSRLYAACWFLLVFAKGYSNKSAGISYN